MIKESKMWEEAVVAYFEVTQMGMKKTDTEHV
jgi:hypothetical protein